MFNVRTTPIYQKQKKKQILINDLCFTIQKRFSNKQTKRKIASVNDIINSLTITDYKSSRALNLAQILKFQVTNSCFYFFLSSKYNNQLSEQSQVFSYQSPDRTLNKFSFITFAILF